MRSKVHDAIVAGPRAYPQGLRTLAARSLDALLILWLFLSNGALLPLLVSEPGSTEMSDGAKGLLRFLVLPSFALAALLVALRPRAMLAALVRHPLLTLLLVWVWCSLAWSLDPSVSLRRASALTAYTLIACWLAIGYEPVALLRRLTGVLLAQLLLSLAFAAAFPALAFMPDDHLLRGIFLHKNVLGQVVVFAAILLLLGWQFRAIPRFVAGLGLGLVATMAAMTGSATALLLIGVVAGVQLLPAILARPPREAAATLLLLMAAAMFALLGGILLIDEAMALLGRDFTLTGRTQLWALAVSMIQERPLLGYGYAVFFDLPSVAYYVEEALRWKIPNAHSGFLEVALGLGLPGAALVTFMLLAGLARALRTLGAARHGDPAVSYAAAFSLLYLLAYSARNLVESDLVSQSQMSWVLAVVALLLPTVLTRAPGLGPPFLAPGLWRR